MLLQSLGTDFLPPWREVWTYLSPFKLCEGNFKASHRVWEPKDWGCQENSKGRRPCADKWDAAELHVEKAAHSVSKGKVHVSMAQVWTLQ